jgi:hypothetical protein
MVIFDPSDLFKTIVGWLGSLTSASVIGWWAKGRAHDKAMKGDELTSEGSLAQIVKSELKKLAQSSKLPQELQSEAERLRGSPVNPVLELSGLDRGRQGLA